MKFLGYLVGSRNEVATQAAIAQRAGLLDEASFQQIYRQADTVA